MLIKLANEDKLVTATMNEKVVTNRFVKIDKMM